VAEKFQAMVVLGIANSRMKDFFDLWHLTNAFEFGGASLCKAVHATFDRRKTELPVKPPLALTSEFGTDPAKVRQWQGFLKKGKLEVAGATLERVCSFLNGFLMPPDARARSRGRVPEHVAAGWSVDGGRRSLMGSPENKPLPFLYPLSGEAGEPVAVVPDRHGRGRCGVTTDRGDRMTGPGGGRPGPCRTQ
jgi:hypothetical protein